MSWPPRTWTTSELVTASIMNEFVRDPLTDLQGRVITVTIGDPIGPVLSTGVKSYVPVPFECEVVGWEIFGDASGDIVLDVWADSYANFPPTVADTIAGSEKPTLSGAQKNPDLALSTWDASIAAGSILAINIDSCSGIKQVTLSIRVEMA
jgi:hypothetical protein